MYYVLTGILLGSIGFSVADIASQFEESRVAPDVVNKAPIEELEVKYGEKKLKFGDELTPTQVKDMPDIDFKHEDSALYTLIMIDPDAPTRKAPIMREWQHWIVINIPGDDVSKGETLADYVGAGPPQGSGLHRYVILVFKQPGKLTVDEKHRKITDQTLRERFSTKKFAAKYNLGEPVAGNLFLAQWDDYVPTLYRKLSGKD
ncbi:protein D2-like [Belonocnema kinseyi]|uniref:protein D2-like n=1 Tax=Belonocnema kinseyi TaxID=2817044 RepID=UPI00143D73AB|nr:protein D2-like [Belonocnema kinseyi]